MTCENMIRLRYRLRRATPGADTVEVTVPRPVIQRELKRRELTFCDFIAKVDAEWMINGTSSIDLGFRFVERGES